MIPCGNQEASERLTVVIDEADYESILGSIYKILGCADIKNKKLLPALSYQLQGGTKDTCPVCVFAESKHLVGLIKDCRTYVERKKSANPAPTVKLVVDPHVRCALYLFPTPLLTLCSVALPDTSAQHQEEGIVVV